MSPSTSRGTLSDREDWHRLGMRVRLGLRPDDPRLISAYLRAGEQLISKGHAPWPIHDQALSLLLATAYDAFLPIAWRVSCLDTCGRPLSALGGLVSDDQAARRLQELARRLAAFSYNPFGPDCAS